MVNIEEPNEQEQPSQEDELPAHPTTEPNEAPNGPHEEGDQPVEPDTA
jgi:hypothetical protein